MKTIKHVRKAKVQDRYIPVLIEETIEALEQAIREWKRLDRLPKTNSLLVMIRAEELIDREMSTLMNRWFDEQFMSQKTTPAVKRALRKVFKKILKVKFRDRKRRENVIRRIKSFEKTVAKPHK